MFKVNSTDRRGKSARPLTGRCGISPEWVPKAQQSLRCGYVMRSKSAEQEDHAKLVTDHSAPLARIHTRGCRAVFTLRILVAQ